MVTQLHNLFIAPVPLYGVKMDMTGDMTLSNHKIPSMKKHKALSLSVMAPLCILLRDQATLGWNHLLR